MMEIKTLNNSTVHTASTVADSLTAEVNLSAIQTALDLLTKLCVCGINGSREAMRK